MPFYPLTMMKEHYLQKILKLGHLGGGYVCLLEELSWNSDARWKGGAAAATPDLQSSDLTSPAWSARRLQPSGPTGHGRSPGAGAAADPRAGPSAPRLFEGQEGPPLLSSATGGGRVIGDSRGDSTSRAGRSHAISMPPHSTQAQILLTLIRAPQRHHDAGPRSAAGVRLTEGA